MQKYSVVHCINIPYLVVYITHWCIGSCCELESRSGEMYLIQHYVIKDKVCQWQWFSHGTPVSSTNKTDRQDITEILFKMVLNIITLRPNPLVYIAVIYTPSIVLLIIVCYLFWCIDPILKNESHMVCSD